MNTTQIYSYIERLGNLLRADSRRDVAEYGLQPIHLEVLHYLSLCNRYSDTPMGVTDYMGQTKGTVSQTLKVLEKKGLLSKHPDSHDKRMTHLKVSNAGKELLQAAIPSSLLIHACAQLTEQSQTETIKVLKELLQAIQHSNGMKSFGVCHTCRYNHQKEDNHYFCELTQEALSNEEIQLICREHENMT
jgi:DNA-binding MarR family transcriptional regulator